MPSVLFNDQAIVSDSELSYTISLNGINDISFSVHLTGGVAAAAANVTADVTFHALNFDRDIKPVPVDISKSGYRADAGQTIQALGGDSVQSVGVTEAIAWVDFKNVNADEFFVKVNFSAAPLLATPGKVVVKMRRKGIN
jgi:hypothetical protein